MKNKLEQKTNKELAEGIAAIGKSLLKLCDQLDIKLDNEQTEKLTNFIQLYGK